MVDLNPHQTITQTRVAAFNNGYRPVPISGINMRVKHPGKQPVMENWRETCSSANEQMIRAWSDQAPGCTNTGMMTGISGGIVAADIDVLLPEVAAEIADLATELLGATPLQRIGKAPKTLYVYRVSADFRKVKTPAFTMPDGSKAQVEFLAEGQQFVSDGLHPETRQPYRWVDGSPVNVSVDQLPQVDRDAAEIFIDCAAQVLRDHGGIPQQPCRKTKSVVTGKYVEGSAAPVGDNFFSNVNSAALANLETWVRALFGSKARFHPGTGSFRVRSEDLGRDLEEDISFHPQGAWDYGLEKPLSAIDAVIEHGGATDAKEAAHWLCEKLNIAPVSLGWSEFKAKAKDDQTEAKKAEPAAGDDVTLPFDMFGDTSLTGVPTLPQGCVPDVIEAFARDSGERLGIDPAMIAAGSVVACAAVIDDEWKIQPKEHDTTWTESSRLWLGTIAPPSAKKTPALNAVISPLRGIDREYAEADEPLHEQFEIETKIHLKKMDAYTAAKAKGENVPQPLPPVKPPVRRLVVNDVTVPKLGEILSDNPSGVICVNDELASWFATLDNKETGAKDRADWLSAYNGGAHVVDRIKRGTVRIPNWSACMIGTIQPGLLRNLTSKMSDDGLMQRFMLIYATASGRGVDRAPDARAIATYHKLVRTLKDLKPAHRETPIRLSPEAQVERETMLDIIDVIMALPDSPEQLAYHVGKWDGLFSRLCLTYHMVEAAARNEYPRPFISGNTAKRVLLFMRDLLLPNTMKFYREMFAGSPNLDLARWIAGYIIAHSKEKVTQRDVYRAYSSNLRDKPHLINDAMRLLDLANWVYPVESRNGRDVTEWKVNLAVHTVFAERAAQEKKRRDDVKATIARAAKLGIKTKTKAA